MRRSQTLKDLVKKAWVLEKGLAAKGTEYKSGGCLLIYVTAYAVQASGGSAGTYFCFADANLSSPESLKKTALSLKQFCKMVQKINCVEKTVILDVCHCEAPRGGLLKAIKVYPPSDLCVCMRGANQAALHRITRSLVRCLATSESRLLALHARHAGTTCTATAMLRSSVTVM